jgi:hypothetical protein
MEVSEIGITFHDEGYTYSDFTKWMREYKLTRALEKGGGE